MRGVTHPVKTYAMDFFISTHTPHARRDNGAKQRFVELKKFQLTRLMRGVTDNVADKVCRICISTHTPHARRDGRWEMGKMNEYIFQLTRLMRGVTGIVKPLKMPSIFQLTRLMRGVTGQKRLFSNSSRNFNSHASCEA